VRELSLNILDIAQNSVKAGAQHIDITLMETDELFTFAVKDDGCGMSEELLARVKDPFTTTRTTRKVGLGIPFLTLAARQTGGDVTIESSVSPNTHGTLLEASFYKKHIDFTPLGDIISTVVTLIQGNPDRDITFTHDMCGTVIRLSTAEMREMLGSVPLSEPDVLVWIREYLTEQYGQIK